MIVFLSLCPFLFFYITCRQRYNLNDPSILERFGALYTGMNRENIWAGTYSFVFLLRRSVFVLITFVSFRDPSHQVLAMVTVTVLQICFLSHMRIHETKNLLRIEAVNEFILLCLCYHFLLFVDPAWSFDFIE